MRHGFLFTAALLATAVSAGPSQLDAIALQRAFTAGKVKVVGLERHLGPPKVPDGAFARACLAWNLTDKQVLSFFSQAEAIGPDEMRSDYPVVPCQYSGTLTIDGVSYQFAINIGRFGFIRGAAPDDVALFGCKEVCKDLFRTDVTDNS
jgi:hypothetical protein